MDPYCEAWQEPSHRLTVDGYVLKMISDRLRRRGKKGRKEEGPGTDAEYSTTTEERTSDAIAEAETDDYRELEEARNEAGDDPLIKKE